MPTVQETLHVFMNNAHVGQLLKLRGGSLAFKYEASWLENENARPISLSIPLTQTYHDDDTVYNFFDNLLPDNEAIKGRIQARFGIKTTQAFDLLSCIGHDCVGAIQLYHSKANPDVKKITAEALNENQIAEILASYAQAPLGMSKMADDFRISIAGAQEKTALLYHDNQWQRPLGATPTSHIFKLPIGRIGHQDIDLSESCENEWLCCQIAQAFGFDVAATEICTFNDKKALVVERFDRKLSSDGSWVIRLPQEDMCQALGYSSHLKYQSDGGPGIQQIMALLLNSQQAKVDRKHFFSSQILFWLLAAIDGHAKNFSIFINEQGRFQLAPLYDIISAYPLITNKSLQKQKIKMAMALKGKNTHYRWHMIQKRHFLSTAKLANYSVKEAGNILDEMFAQIEPVISQVSAKLPPGFPAAIAEPIFDGMRSI